MVPDIAGKGHSFAGAMTYYLHDKRRPGDDAHPRSAERVAWTAVRNLPVDDPHFAMRLMIATASQAETLKRQAGVTARGRRSTKAVYAFSLSWHPDEAAGLDRAEMLKAADAALKVLGCDHLQSVIVCHRDQPHPHVHCIVNRVDPADGRMAGLSKDRERLSKWAYEYERGRGPLLTPERAKKYGRDAEREGPQPADREPQPEADKIEAAKDRQPRQSAQWQRRVLAKQHAEQRERHESEWQAASEAFKAERKAVCEKHPSVKAIITEHRKQRQAEEAALQKRQAQDRQSLEARSRGFIGRFKLALATAREQRAPDSGQLSFAKAVVGFAVSPGKVLQRLERTLAAERQAFAKQSKAALSGRIAEAKSARQLELRGINERFQKAREGLVERQSAEKARMKEAWRSLPQPERGGRERPKMQRAMTDARQLHSRLRTAGKASKDRER